MGEMASRALGCCEDDDIMGLGRMTMLWVQGQHRSTVSQAQGGRWRCRPGDSAGG
jgi:hypothetical protein